MNDKSENYTLYKIFCLLNEFCIENNNKITQINDLDIIIDFEKVTTIFFI